MRTIVVTGSASGIGAATRKRLTSQGARVIGVDLRDAEVQADLSTAKGRREATACADALGSPATYPASKLALAHWVRRHATKPEWAGAGITLNAVAPGKTETGMLAEGPADAKYGPLIDAFPTPVGRSGDPDGIAALICFLLSPDARFLCGSVVFCDGGTDAQLRPDAFPAPWERR